MVSDHTGRLSSASRAGKGWEEVFGMGNRVTILAFFSVARRFMQERLIGARWSPVSLDARQPAGIVVAVDDPVDGLGGYVQQVL